jgi:iron complex outermembrane receptor protein
LTDPDSITEPAKYSTRWIEDRTFVRLQNITVGYTFNVPARIAAVQTARVYVAGDNLLLATGYKGYDPEVYSGVSGLAVRGVDWASYPRPRTFTFGVHFQF